MTVLTSEQRKLLSDVVVRARDLVEAACAQRIAALGVAADKAPSVLTEEERAVRVGLRARSRQLGSVDALVSEAGFEHWHRMLFARFLADNGLLVDDQYGQPLTMGDVAEYAAEMGEADKWEVAARFAAAMLPGIFLQDDPILKMRLPVETRQELEGLLDRVPANVITAEDSLGWVYQYWQAKRKAEVNKSERKIGGADLAPVTQLFTENYMVRFLLENSLGAWWAARQPDSPLLAGWEYLRRNEDGSPVVGRFDGWPERIADVTVMDPCCGSGHFLVAAFGMLWRMRAEEEDLTSAAAQDAVLRDNLFGLELDARCTQIAMFALALEAWKAGGYRVLPLPNVACCGIPARAPLSDWLELAGGDPQVEAALTRLHALFANADTLGSLIDPVSAAEQAGLQSVDWHNVAPLVTRALSEEAARAESDPAAAVFGHAAAGVARAADYLSCGYSLISTNPPFLGINNHSETLASHLAENHYVARHDIALSLVERMMEFATCAAVVVPSEWMFVARYQDLRKKWLRHFAIPLTASLGYGAFTTPLRANVSLTILQESPPLKASSIVVLDVSQGRTVPDKARSLIRDAPLRISQHGQLQNPDSVIMRSSGSGNMLRLKDVLIAAEGISSGDANRFEREFWEVVEVGTDRRWAFLQDAARETSPYAGRSGVVLWENGEGSLAALAQSVRHLNHAAQNWQRGRPLWGRPGVVVNLLGHLRASLYVGDKFGKNCTALVPNDVELVGALWAFAESGALEKEVRAFHSKMDVSPGAILKVPFNPDVWRGVAAERFPDGLPEPFSNDPTQWLFGGSVADCRAPLQVAVGRLLGFKWPEQVADDLDVMADQDGVVCLPALGGESTAAERLRAVLAAAFGDAWSAQALDVLLVEVGWKPTAAGLEKWLRDGFFKDHCKVFANRPFIWQIWDGRSDGFSALVNYHKLDRKLLERLTYDYLGSWWIGRLNDEVRQQAPGAELRLVAAEELKRKLELILDGEPPYDLFVRWKPLAEQPIGWDPHLDDGVRMNIRPFVNAGVLRVKPSIKWDKDRGKNPDGSERPNDLHFTLAQKRAARGGAS